MDHSSFNAFCKGFTASTHVVQWGGSDVWKVGEKVFAIGSRGKSGQPAFTFKTSDLNFEFLLHAEGYIPAPYLASRGLKWIQQIDTRGHLDEDLKYYTAQSYNLVAGGLSKRKRETFGIDISVDPDLR